MVASTLPLLPLMLACVPRAVADLLREAGVPTAPLPKLLPGDGVGRFVLFDAQNAKSASAARRAQSQGLEAVDLRALRPGSGSDVALFSDELDYARPGLEAGEFLYKLKAELEHRGGLWLRIADYPFPYQSALCLSVEHRSRSVDEILAVATAFPGKATHFISTHIPTADLSRIAPVTGGEWSWLVDDAALEQSSRKTQNAWTKRVELFRAAGLHVQGLALNVPGTTLPPARTLLDLGFSFSCDRSSMVACRCVQADRRLPEALWMHFHTVEIGAPPPLLPHPPLAAARPLTDMLERAQARRHRLDRAHVLSDELSSANTQSLGELITGWVGDHYRSGHPLFIREPSSRLDLMEELAGLNRDAARCSLMWQTTFYEFTRWWKLRREIGLRVSRTADGYDFQVLGDLQAAPCAVEIWRGNHLATVPLKQSQFTLPDDGLVFLNGLHRGPGGFTVPAGSIEPPSEGPSHPLATLDAH